MSTRRLLLSPLLFLVALAAMLGLNASSAAAGSATETRVRAFEHVTVDAVGQQSSETAGSVGCLRPSQPGLASGSCVATNTADDAARFVADSAGNTTLRAQGPSGWLDVTSHAAKRMTQRGISIADVDQALTQTPFNYWHSNMWKVGYYDAGTNVFVGTANGVATTVITPSAGPQYVANLLAAAP